MLSGVDILIRWSSPFVGDTGLMDGGMWWWELCYKGSLQCLRGHMSFICPLGHDQGSEWSEKTSPMFFLMNRTLCVLDCCSWELARGVCVFFFFSNIEPVGFFLLGWSRGRFVCHGKHHLLSHAWESLFWITRVIFLFLVKPWLNLNSLCRQGCPGTQRSACPCWIKGVCYYAQWS